MSDITVAEIARNLAQHPEDLCRELLPNGHRVGSEWRCGSIDGEPGKSLSICLTGARAGTWSDFAGPPGNGGDLIDLIEKVEHLDKGGAVKWAKDRLGIGSNFGLPPIPTAGVVVTGDTPKASAPAAPDEIMTPALPIPSTAGKAPPHPKHGKPSQRYAYRDANGDVLFIANRFEANGPKALPLTYWRSIAGKGEWKWKALPTPRPLYGLHELAKRPDAHVLMTEGEKTAQAACSPPTLP